MGISYELEQELSSVTLCTPEQLKERMPHIKALFKDELYKSEDGLIQYYDDAIAIKHLNMIERDDLFEQELTKFSKGTQSVVQNQISSLNYNGLPDNRDQLIIKYLRTDSSEDKRSLYRALIQNFTYEELTTYIGVDKPFSDFIEGHYYSGDIPIVLIRGGYTHNLKLVDQLFHTLVYRVFNYNILRPYQDELRTELNKLYLRYYVQSDELNKPYTINTGYVIILNSDYLRWIHRCELELGWDMSEERTYYAQRK